MSHLQSELPNTVISIAGAPVPKGKYSLGNWITLDQREFDVRMRGLLEHSHGDIRIAESYFQSSLYRTKNPLIIFENDDICIKVQKKLE
jgi:hypothetical protein